MFVSKRNGNVGEEGQDEYEARGYVPLTENDTGTFDLRVPIRLVGIWQYGGERGEGKGMMHHDTIRSPWKNGAS